MSKENNNAYEFLNRILSLSQGVAEDNRENLMNGFESYRSYLARIFRTDLYRTTYITLFVLYYIDYEISII